MNCKAQVKFKDGTFVKRVQHAMYVGSTITVDASRDAEISNRLSKALTTVRKLHIFWPRTNASKNWNLLV